MSRQRENLFRVSGHKLEVFVCQIKEEIRNPLTMVSYLLMKAAQREGNQFQTLLGVTGSGKTFTMANIIQELQKPTLVLAHNKTLAAQLYGEFKEMFPENAVEYFVSYYY